MNSIEFGKKCKQHNIEYKNIFGYTPCIDNYICNQDEYFDALLKSIEEKKEISNFLQKKQTHYKNTNKKY